MRAQLHRAILRRFLLRVIGVVAMCAALWFFIPGQSSVEPILSQASLFLFGLVFIFGPAIWPRMQRLRMRLSVPRPSI